MDGYAIVPPISPWDEKHREAIELDTAMQTIGHTPAQAWRRWCTRQSDIYLDPYELSNRVQFWFDRGYRVRQIRLELIS